MNIKIKVLNLFLVILFVNCQGTTEQKPISDVKAQSVPVEQKVSEYQHLKTVDFVTGNFNPAEHKDFEAIPSNLADRAGMYAHKECLRAFKKMHKAAAKEGIDIIIRSAARNFDYQRSIWEAKWNGDRILTGGINAKKQIPEPLARAKEIMKYSAMPGASRHHWGTDLDFNAFNNTYFESGPGLTLFKWLEEHAISFGFGRPYIAKGTTRPNGYEEEKWHWSYLPISTELTQFAADSLTNKDLKGFSGSETASDLQVKEHYILGISNDCLWH